MVVHLSGFEHFWTFLDLYREGSGFGVRFEGLLDLDVVVFGKPAGGRCAAGERTILELRGGVGGAEECLEAQDGTIVTIEGREAAWLRV